MLHCEVKTHRKNFILAGRDFLQNESERGAVMCCDQFSYKA